MLYRLGITGNKSTQTAKVFGEMIPDFFEVKYSNPSDYVSYCWNEYQKRPEKSNNLNGKIFEVIIATLCIREDLLPFFLQANVTFVPNVNFDLMFFRENVGPIYFSNKTSLRERYKQADLESFALKNVHRNACCYLITMNEAEANNLSKKIASGDVLGLDKVIVATSNRLDELIYKLKTYRLIDPPSVEIINSNQVVTHETVKKVYTKKPNY